MNSEGWNCTGPIASQLVLPPTSMPSGVATTSSCKMHEAMSTGHAMRIQKLSGMRLASSIERNADDREDGPAVIACVEEAAVGDVGLDERRREHHDEPEDHEEERGAEQQEVVGRLDVGRPGPSRMRAAEMPDGAQPSRGGSCGAESPSASPPSIDLTASWNRLPRSP